MNDQANNAFVGVATCSRLQRGTVGVCAEPLWQGLPSGATQHRRVRTVEATPHGVHTPQLLVPDPVVVRVLVAALCGPLGFCSGPAMVCGCVTCGRLHLHGGCLRCKARAAAAPPNSCCLGRSVCASHVLLAVGGPVGSVAGCVGGCVDASTLHETRGGQCCASALVLQGPVHCVGGKTRGGSTVGATMKPGPGWAAMHPSWVGIYTGVWAL